MIESLESKIENGNETLYHFIEKIWPALEPYERNGRMWISIPTFVFYDGFRKYCGGDSIDDYLIEDGLNNLANDNRLFYEPYVPYWVPVPCFRFSLMEAPQKKSKRLKKLIKLFKRGIYVDFITEPPRPGEFIADITFVDKQE